MMEIYAEFHAAKAKMSGQRAGEERQGDRVNRRYIRALSLTGLKEVADRFGGDLPAALRHAGLDPALLRHGDAPMDFERFCALLEHCAESWGPPDLAFRVAQYQHLEVLGPVALVTRMERNLRDAILSILRNLTIYTDVLVAALEERDGAGAVILSAPAQRTPTRQYMFLALAVTRNVLNGAAGRPLRLIEARFREPALGAERTAGAWFACPVRFGAERDALYFDGALLDLPLERSDTAYHALIRRYLHSEREALGGRVADIARREVARQMELGLCSLESVAHALKMEPRSLQRRMKAEGSSFRELVDDWRRDRAMSLVTQTRLPLSDVADALGYAHQAVFTRAFSRWYGQAPLACRREANGAI